MMKDVESGEAKDRTLKITYSRRLLWAFITVSMVGFLINMKPLPQSVFILFLATYLIVDKPRGKQSAKYITSLLLVLSTFVASNYLMLKVLAPPSDGHSTMPIAAVIAGLGVGALLSPIAAWAYLRWAAVEPKTDYAWISGVTLVLVITVGLDHFIPGL